MANRVILNGAGDLRAIWPPPSQEGSTVYGLKERVFNEPTILDIDSLLQAAKTRYELLNRPITTIEIPAGARLSPSAPLEINDLIPGSRQRIIIREACVQLAGLFRLSQVEVDYTASGESIKCTWIPLGTTVD